MNLKFLLFSHIPWQLKHFFKQKFWNNWLKNCGRCATAACIIIMLNFIYVRNTSCMSCKDVGFANPARNKKTCIGCRSEIRQILRTK